MKNSIFWIIVAGVVAVGTITCCLVLKPKKTKFEQAVEKITDKTEEIKKSVTD